LYGRAFFHGHLTVGEAGRRADGHAMAVLKKITGWRSGPTGTYCEVTFFKYNRDKEEPPGRHASRFPLHCLVGRFRFSLRPYQQHNPDQGEKKPTNIRKDFWGSLFKNLFAKYAPAKDMGMHTIKGYSKPASIRVPPQTYRDTRVTSMNNAIKPEVKIYTSFGRLNVVRKAPRIAPPTPKKPANRPERRPTLRIKRGSKPSPASDLLDAPF
jgi:hypothetical protein